MATSNTPVTTIQEQLRTGSLSLDQGVLGTACFTALSGLFGSTPLHLTNAENIILKNDWLDFSGCVEFFSQSPVRIQCRLIDRGRGLERHGILKIEMSAETYQQKYMYSKSVTVNDSAETMLDLYIPEITYDSKEMIFSSLSFADDEQFDKIYPSDFTTVVSAPEIKAGLNFPLTARLDGNFAGLIADLFSGSLQAGHAHGLICLPASQDSPPQKPYFFISQEINAGLQLNPPGSPPIGLELERFGLGFALIDEGEIWPRSFFFGKAVIGVQSLALQVYYDLYNQFLSLTFRDFPSFRTVLTSFCVPTEYFSSPFDALLEIQLASLEIGFDLPGRKVTEIDLSVTTEHEVTLVQNIVSIKPILDLQIQSPFDMNACSLQGTLSGDWVLGSTKFETSLNYPSFDMHAALAQGQVLDVDALANNVFGIALPDIAITGMELNGNFAQNSFTFNLEIASDWEIQLANTSKLALQQLQMAMNYVEQQPDYRISGLVNMTGVDIYVSAQYTADGWQFEGSTGPGQDIPIGELINDLTTQFGALEPDLPPALEELVIKNLDVSFNTQSKQFKFTGQADLPIDDENKNFLAITLTFDVSQSKDGYQIELSVQFEVEQTDGTSLAFDLIFKHEGDADILLATYSYAPEKDATEKDASEKDATEKKKPVKISDLILVVIPTGDDQTALIQGLDFSIDVKNVIFAIYKGPAPKPDDEEKPADQTKGTLQPAAQNESDEKPRPTKILFGLEMDIDAGVSFSGLPLVGQELPELGLDSLRVLIASRPFEAADTKAINELLPDDVTDLPEEKPSETGKPEDQDIPATEEKKAEDELQNAETPVVENGFTLSAVLKLGEEKRTLVLSPSGSMSPASQGGKPQPALLASGSSLQAAGSEGESSPVVPDDKQQTAAPSVKWIRIERSFGPVRFDRIGFLYQDQWIWFLMDASLTASGLTISLAGLGFHANISPFGNLAFDLQGLGIEFKKDQLEIGGAFMRLDDGEYDGKPVLQYGGKAILKTDKFSLSAVGLYADLPGQPSMFIYAFLDYPLGGPPVFYVTGLAAGFGFNRSLLMPSIDKVKEFPLVAEARGEEEHADKLTDELDRFAAYVQVQSGQYFLAAGVKFTSFKMIDSFAMLAVSFGQRLQIDLVGISTIKVPYSEKDPNSKVDSKPCLSEIQVAFMASFIPDDGVVTVVARLTSSSYILSKDNHPTGGLAFYTWFAGDHSGDFVLSVGGYHSKFQVPAHYPIVPRLALSWQVSSCLSIKGDAYFALTPSMLMAGGNLEANWHSGPLEAWFKAQADFLIAWQPFHYDAYMFVNMGIAYTFQINTWFGSWTQRLTAELVTELHVWGPEFAGIARVRVSFITFDVAFSTGPSLPPPSIDWDKFKEAFLPKDLEDVLNVSVRNGLISGPSNGTPADPVVDLGILDPSNISLVVDSLIPVKTCKVVDSVTPLKTYKVVGVTENPFGIAPMGKPVYEPELQITITRAGVDQKENFEFAKVQKNVPAGLWGTKPGPTLDSEPMVKDVISGCVITVKLPAESPAAPPAEGTVKAAILAKPAAVSPVNAPAAMGTQEIAAAEQEPKERELALQWESGLRLSAGTPATKDPRQTIRESLHTANGRRQDMLAALGIECDAITLKESLAEAFVAAPQIEG